MTNPEYQNPKEARRPKAGRAGVGLAVVAAGLLSGCGTGMSAGSSGLARLVPSADGPVTVSQLEAIRKMPDLRFEKVNVRMQVATGKRSESMVLPEVTARRGQPVKVFSGKDFIYPTDFDFAKVNQSAGAAAGTGASPITPTTPRSFTTQNEGLTVAFTATARGPFIMLNGTVTESVCERMACNPGLAFSPIVTDDRKVIITENKCVSPQFTDRITHFHLAARPGESLTIPLNSKVRNRVLKVAAVLPDSSDYRVVAPLKFGSGPHTVGFNQGPPASSY